MGEDDGLAVEPFINIKPYHQTRIFPPGQPSIGTLLEGDPGYPAETEREAAKELVMQEMPEYARLVQEARTKTMEVDEDMVSEDDYGMVVTPLGTGSAIPSKYRNGESPRPPQNCVYRANADALWVDAGSLIDDLGNTRFWQHPARCGRGNPRPDEAALRDRSLGGRLVQDQDPACQSHARRSSHRGQAYLGGASQGRSSIRSQRTDYTRGLMLTSRSDCAAQSHRDSVPGCTLVRCHAPDRKRHASRRSGKPAVFHR